MVAFAAFVACVALTGGSSRADAVQLLLLRPATILYLAAITALGWADLRACRAPVLLLAALAATMILQLIPLPPGWWWAMPGHAQLGSIARTAGVADAWRPISLTPDLTLNSLIALLPPLAALLGLSGLSREERSGGAALVAGVAVVSALTGLLQLLGGAGSALYLYAITSPDLPVGLFANRNHEAVFLALALPVLAWWSDRSSAGGGTGLRLAAAGAGALVLVPAIVLTGSRSGVTAAGIGLVVAAGLLWHRWPDPARAGWVRAAKLLTILSPVLLLVVVVLAGRALSVDRLLDTSGDLNTERRLLALPVMLRMLRDFAPFGIGYGAFDPAFRFYEPGSLLFASYFNRAHDDLLEIVLSGGLPALAVLLCFLGWFGRATAAAWRAGREERRRRPAVLGAVVIAIWCLASLTDYPLRTPLAGVVFAIACGWLCRTAPRAEA